MKQLRSSAVRDWILLLVGLPILLVCYFTLPLDRLGTERPVLSWTLFCLALTLLTVLLLRKMWQVLTGAGGRPGLGLVFLIGLALIVFAATYYGLGHGTQEFAGLNTRLDSLYFTVVTMSTVGYGDITPAGQVARLLVVLQIFYNFVFLATAAGTLSSSLRRQLGTRAREGRLRGGPRGEPNPEQAQEQEQDDDGGEDPERPPRPGP
ncbi:potassium channel family protein [Kitasatospora sp. NBC_00315]|uniref:potassium channel family protein n=1 Tax=Kitasatospora sp. NBC_00315 TaxID=2975963 RepID=UPI0032556075